VLARSALAQGSFRLAAHQRLTRVIDASPVLDYTRATRAAVRTTIGNVTLGDRVCLLAPSARGFELLTDVTCAGDPLLRAGSVRRLVDVVLRAARALGEEIAFEANGEGLWTQVRTRLSDLGRLLLAAGALSSDAGTTAFVVRCGRDTMTQNDIDAGRLIAEVELVPAQPVTRIVVVLALRDARPSGTVRRAA
jgi:phage tail sheath protein FI